MRILRILLFTLLMTAPFARAQELVANTATAPCTANCTGILISWPATTQPVPNCSATVASGCFSGYQVVLTPPPNTGNAVTLTPATTGGPTATSYLWRPGGQLYNGTWTVTIQAIGVGTTDGAVMTTTMSYMVACVTPAPSAVTQQ